MLLAQGVSYPVGKSDTAVLVTKKLLKMHVVDCLLQEHVSIYLLCTWTFTYDRQLLRQQICSEINT